MYWYRDDELDCRFEDLFEPIDNVDVNECARGELEPGTIYQVEQDEHQWSVNQPTEHAEIEQRFIASSHRFFGSADFSAFVPVESLRTRITKNNIDAKQTIGIHIRRTDHEEAIRSSPTENFLTLMRQAQQKDPQTKFFVATDCDKEAATLTQEFGENLCMARSRIACRRTTEGMQDAIVDLFSLAQCRTIYGSAGSSFSKTAAAIGRIPLLTVSNEPVS